MKMLIVCFSFLLSIIAFAQLPSEIERYDIGFYLPQKNGVSDLVFDVEVEGLKEKINLQKSMGELKELKFRVYWETNNKFVVDVIGMPSGFKEIKASLIGIVMTRMEYVIPNLIKDQLASFSVKKNSDGTIIANDPSGKNYISEIKIEFSPDGKLSKLEAISPAGSRSSIFEMSTKSWSKNKWVADKITMKIKEGLQISDIVNTIDYMVVNGVGFPRTVTIDSKISSALTVDKKEAEVLEDQVVYNFSNYQINSGKAIERHRKGK